MTSPLQKGAKNTQLDTSLQVGVDPPISVPPPTALVSPKGARRWANGHPWIYRSDVVEVDAVGGAIVWLIVGVAVGMGAYGMDSHNCQRYVTPDGYVQNEGDVQVHGFEPYPISYRSIIPKADECTNLLVPVCLSSSHIAYGSIRMEPVFMILAQSAATGSTRFPASTTRPAWAGP